MKIFIAKLPYQFKEDDLTELFAPYGEVSSANVIMDPETGRSKCYAFVEMPNDEEANAAISGLDGKEILDKGIAVSQAKEREKPAGGSGGYRGGGGGGYSGGGGYRGGNSDGGYRGGNSSGGGNYRDKGNGGGGNYRSADKKSGGGDYRDRSNKGKSEDY